MPKSNFLVWVLIKTQWMSQTIRPCNSNPPNLNGGVVVSHGAFLAGFGKVDAKYGCLAMTNSNDRIPKLSILASKTSWNMHLDVVQIEISPKTWNLNCFTLPVFILCRRNPRNVCRTNQPSWNQVSQGLNIGSNTSTRKAPWIFMPS